MGGAAVDIQGKTNITIINGVMSAGVSTGCNSAGTTGTVSNQIIFCGGNNVTLSESINGQSATITIIGGAGGAQSVQSYNILSAGSQIANTTGTVLFNNANSISFGMSNSSVITAQYDLKSHSSNYHTSIIGAESQITFDPIAGHDHDGVGSKLIITPQYLEVSKAPAVGESGKQFTTIAAALAAAVAGGASSAKPYVIKVYPGTYTEAPFTMVAYVAIIGSGVFNTIITTSNLTANFITGTANSYIRDCSIVGPTDASTAAFYYNQITSPFTIQDVLIRQGYYGVWADSPITGGNVHCINVNNWYNGTNIHTFMYSTNYGTIVAMNCSFMCGPAGKITRGFACDSANAEIYMDLCNFRNTPTGPNPNDAVFVDNGGKVKLIACTFSIGTNAIHIGANGTGGYVIAVGCNIRNEVAAGYVFTTDILMDSAGTLQYTGSCTKSKITITNPGAVTFSASFTDSTTGQEGAVVVGEMWLGASVANSIPLRDYGLNVYSTGWRAGGAVTRAGGLNVSVALGSGYINTGAGVTRISWAAITPILCTANSEQWIYVDNAGTVTISAPGSEPNYPDVIMLAAIRTDATNVVFLANHDILLQQSLPSSYDFIEKVFGSISTEGCTVTQAPGIGNELKVDFTTGKYFFGLHKLQPVSTPSITFTYWYRKVGSTGWNTATPGGGGSNFDTAQYDNNSGALVPIPGGKYKKDLLFVIKNDVGTEFHVVYGQRYFDTLDQAKADTGFETPGAFEDYALKLSGIVVLSGAGVLASIVDEKKKFVSVHNELKDLQGGNSATSQFYHLDYNEWSSRNQKIVASLLTAGNTAGVMAVISSGTLYLAGGNNVTLSQNANSVTISGPNMAIAAGGVTTTASTFTFGDTNGVSFQISNGSIVGSIGTYLTSQSNQALSGSNGSFAFQTASFGISNDFTFYTTNGSMVGSYTVPVQTSEPRVISLNGTSGSLSISGASNITVSALNGSTITIYGPANILNSFSVSGNTGTTGSSNITGGGFILAGGSNITLSQSNNSISIHGPSPSAAGIAAIGNTASSNAFTSGSVQFSGLANITVNTSANGASQYIQISAANPAAAAGVSAIAGSNTTYTSGLLILSDQANITIGSSVNGGSQYYRFSVGAGAGIGGIADSASTVTNQTVQFNNANNVSFGLNGSTMTASASYSQSTAPSGLYASGIATTFTSGNIGFSGSNNITVSTAAQVIIISGPNTHAQQTGISGISATDTLYISGTVLFTGSNMITVRSSGLGQTIILDATHPLQTFIGGIAGSGASTVTNGTVQFANLNGITFGLNGSTMTASHNALTSQSTAPSGLYVNAIATTFTSGNINFTGSNNITVTTGAQQIIISGPNTHAVQTGISSIGAAGTTYTSGGVSLYGSGIISLSSTTGQGFVISAPGVVSLNGLSSVITISAGNLISISNIVTTGAQTIHTISVINLLSSSAIAADVSTASSAGSLVSRFALADHAHRGIGTIYASGANGANSFYGPMTIATGNTNLTLSTGLSVLSIFGPSPGAGAAVTLKVFENFKGIQLASQTSTSNQLSLQRIFIPGNITATEFEIIVNMAGASKSSGSATLSAAIYTMTSITANIASSASTAFTWNPSTATGTVYSHMSGTQYREIFNNTNVMNWNITPGEYLIGVIFASDTVSAATWTFYGMSSLSIGAYFGTANHSHIFGNGLYSAATGGFPAAIQASQLVQTGASVLNQPWFRLAGAF